MPGQPWPVLGSALATALVAGAAGLAVTAVVCHPSTRRRASSRRAFAAGVGASYAILTVALWVGVRAIAHSTPLSADVGATAFWLALAALGAGVFAGGTAYAYARFQYVTALLALFAATSFTWYVFLQTDGGSIALAVWGLVYVSVFVVGTAALLAIEWGIRTVTDSSEPGGPPA